jgi:plastocyanin
MMEADMRRAIVASAILALLVTGCAAKKSAVTPGSGSPGSSAPVSLSGTVNDKGTKDASGSSVTLDLSQGNYFFSPTFVKASPGAKVTVTVKNNGDTKHTFTIDSPAVDVTLDSGTTKTVSFKLPAGGVINFYCRFHRSSGMQGAFYFAAGASAPPPSSGSGGGYNSGY